MGFLCQVKQGLLATTYTKNTLFLKASLDGYSVAKQNQKLLQYQIQFTSLYLSTGTKFKFWLKFDMKWFI